MPIDTREKPHVPPSREACRLVVAARVHSDRRTLRRAAAKPADPQLRAARCVDDPATIDAAAADAGIGAEARRLARRPGGRARRSTQTPPLARRPMPAARVLDHKLANWSGGRRYTCPSYEITRIADGVTISVPGLPALRRLRRDPRQPRPRPRPARAAGERPRRSSSGAGSRCRPRRSRRSCDISLRLRRARSSAGSRPRTTSAPTASGTWAIRHERRPQVSILDPEEQSRVRPSGAVGSVQEAEITVERSLLERIWTPTASSCWPAPTGRSCGGCRWGSSGSSTPRPHGPSPPSGGSRCSASARPATRPRRAAAGSPGRSTAASSSPARVAARAPARVDRALRPRRDRRRGRRRARPRSG